MATTMMPNRIIQRARGIERPAGTCAVLDELDDAVDKEEVMLWVVVLELGDSGVVEVTVVVEAMIELVEVVTKVVEVGLAEVVEEVEVLAEPLPSVVL